MKSRQLVPETVFWSLWKCSSQIKKKIPHSYTVNLSDWYLICFENTHTEQKCSQLLSKSTRWNRIEEQFILSPFVHTNTNSSDVLQEVKTTTNNKRRRKVRYWPWQHRWLAPICLQWTECRELAPQLTAPPSALPPSPSPPWSRHREKTTVN